MSCWRFSKTKGRTHVKTQEGEEAWYIDGKEAEWPEQCTRRDEIVSDEAEPLGQSSRSL